MDHYVIIFLVYFCIYIILCDGLQKIQKTSSSAAKYYLSRDCSAGKLMAWRGRGSQGSLQVEADSMEIYSHEFGVEQYPSNFSCVVYVRAANFQRIMIAFNHLYIPDVDAGQMCENGLWCFDTNTPYSPSMVESGGQTGLCKHNFPKNPLVTRQHYFTFTFTSKPTKLSKALLNDPNAGFHLTVTAVFEPDPKTGDCKLPVGSSTEMANEAGHHCVFDKAKAESTVPLLTEQDKPPNKSERVAMCIMPSAICDGVVNCPDGSEEKVDCSKRTSLMSRILSLGVAASIALGVAAVALFMAALFCIACCCYKALVQRHHSPQHVISAPPLLHSPGPMVRRHPYANGSSLSTLPVYPHHKPPSFRAMSSDHVYSYPASMAGSVPYLSYVRQTSSHAGYPGTHTPTSSRSAKSARSGRSSAYGGFHYSSRPPPPSRADSDHREKIIYPVQL